MTNEENELYRFVNDPKYRDKVIAKIHKEQDNLYNKRINTIKSECNKLNKERLNEISKIASARWEKLANGKIYINRTEGKVRINQAEYLYSDIKGATLNIQNSCRIVTSETAKSKKHASLGGAIVGGVLTGSPVGALVGGVGLGKTTTKGSSVSTSIPTCVHYGVVVNINGFPNEIMLISSTVDQSSSAYIRAASVAQEIISQLSSIAHMPVPTAYLLPEQEASVIAFDNQIRRKNEELNVAIADTPTYAIPAIYRTTREANMTDEAYVAYLKSTDLQRESDRNAEQAALKQEKEKYKEEQRKRKHEEKINRQALKAYENPSALKKALIIIYKILFWALSLLVFLLFLGAITTKGAIGSTVAFLFTAILINPLIDDLIDNHLFHFPRWIVLIIFLLGVIVGILLLPPVAATTSTSVALLSYRY